MLGTCALIIFADFKIDDLLVLRLQFFHLSSIDYLFLLNRLWSRKPAKIWYALSIFPFEFDKAFINWFLRTFIDSKLQTKMQKMNLNLEINISELNRLAYMTVTVCKSHLSARKLVFACEWLIILNSRHFLIWTRVSFSPLKARRKI